MIKFAEHNNLVQGDQVEWVADLGTSTLQNLMGKGPFEIKNIDENGATIQTHFGVATLPVQFFRLNQD